MVRVLEAPRAYIAVGAGAGISTADAADVRADPGAGVDDLARVPHGQTRAAARAGLEAEG